MSTSALHKLSALVTPAGQIPSLMSRSINPGIEAYILKGSGAISPGFRATMSQRPAFSASTVAIASALTAFGSGFYAFSAATTLYLAKLIAGGGLAGTLAHAKLEGSKGCIIPRRLRAQQGREATFDFDGYFLSSDGATVPWAYTGSVSLPVIAPGVEAFTLGPAKINGSSLGALEGFELDFGYREIVHASDGNVWPDFACYEEYHPTLTLQTADPTLIGTLTVGGAVQGTGIGTDSIVYLRKLAAGGRVAAATAEHIKLTISAGFHEPREIGENDQGQTVFEVGGIPVYDGTNSILGVNLASAIA